MLKSDQIYYKLEIENHEQKQRYQKLKNPFNLHQ